MKRFVGWTSAAVVAVAGLVACGGESGGGGGGSGVVGTWTIDADKTMGPLVDKIWDSIPAQARDQVKNMTPEQLKMMPPEQREQMEMMTSKDKMKAMMVKEAGDTSIEVKGDGTYVGTSKKKDKTSTSTGTWTQTGDAFTFTPKTEDGQPATGSKGQPHSGRIQGGQLVLEMKNEGAPAMPGGPDLSTMTVYLKRK